MFWDVCDVISEDFVGAVEILAKNLGLEIPRTKSNYDREKFDELFLFNEEAKNFYKNNLLKQKVICFRKNIRHKIMIKFSFSRLLSLVSCCFTVCSNADND